MATDRNAEVVWHGSLMDGEGTIVRLKDQDRGLWNQEMIQLGIQHLAKAAAGEHLSEYHLQAGIAAYHCTASNYASTNWPAILAQYDRWMQMTDSPIVALNRAVALSKVNGPQAGLEAVQAVANRKQLESYYLTYAVLGEFESQLGRYEEATAHLRKALQLTELKSERSFLSKRLQEFDSR